jgi:uncharacterized protein
MLRATSNDMTVVSFVVSIRPFLCRDLGSLVNWEMTARISVNLMTTIRVHVIPNAKIDEVVGEHGDAIKIKLRAAAVEGKANTALRRFLAEKLSIPQRAIVLEHGQKSRDKVIRIDGLGEVGIRRGLLETS